MFAKIWEKKKTQNTAHVIKKQTKKNIKNQIKKKNSSSSFSLIGFKTKIKKKTLCERKEKQSFEIFKIGFSFVCCNYFLFLVFFFIVNFLFRIV